MRTFVFFHQLRGGTESGVLTAGLFSILALVLLSGCGSTKEVKGSESKATQDEIRQFESTFQPSDYDPAKAQPADRHPRLVDTSNVELADDLAVPANQETMQGFRVQVFSTTNIDVARVRKAEFEAAFPDEWFYVEYEAPTYKLRAGNFKNRFEADRFARTLTDQGFPEAWAVPEKVFKSPGKRPPVVQDPGELR
ncbi:MAG: sporulation protein [Bacteroidetes bacterium]|nr:sporulation protein [Bacteroidota bacterium]